MEPWRQRAKERLSPARFAHVAGVAKTARMLAERHGADPVKAEFAGWIHDWYRETSEQELQKLAAEIGMALPPGRPVTWHGPVCAARMKRDFAVDDDEVRLAVAYHTVGHPDMPLLARVVYVADAIEPTRVYPGVDELRTLAQVNLTLALARIADDSIGHLLARGEDISLSTVAMRNAAYGECRDL